MNAFFNHLAPTDRVSLVGDKTQHQAINAGAPFEPCQRAGMHLPRLDEIVRQKGHRLQKAIELFSKGRARDAVELLIKQDRVTEIESPRGRMRSQRQIMINLDKFKQLDHGYAVSSISSQGIGAYRGILNANDYEFALLLNARTAYVANSRAIYDMQIYTNSKEDLPYALDRRSDKEIVLDMARTIDEKREVFEQTRSKDYDIGYSR